MSTEEIRALLVERAEAVDGTRIERADEVLSRVRLRQRRRVAGAAAAAGCLVLALVVGIAVLGGQPARRSDPAPATSVPVDPNPPAPVRRVTWMDAYWPSTTFHYGDRTVDITEELSVRPSQAFVVHTDVTDDGVVFTIARAPGQGRGVWFTDGVDTHRIGHIQGYLGIRNNTAVSTGTAGSLVAWTEDPRGAAPQELVVYDTRADAEAARVPLRPPRGYQDDWYGAGPAIILGDQVFLRWADRLHGRPGVLLRLEVSTGRALERATEADLAAALTASPRGLIVGDSLQSGAVSDGYGQQFAVVGRRLVPMRPVADASSTDDDPTLEPTQAFDTGTGRPVEFRLPAGYDGGADEFEPFEWIDDDRLALMNAPNSWDQATGEILVCRISSGECVIAVGAKPGDATRIAPHLGLPG